MRCIVLLEINGDVKCVELKENMSVLKMTLDSIIIQEKTLGSATLGESMQDNSIVFTEESVVACGNGPYSICYTSYNIPCSRANINVLNNHLDEL